MIQGLLVWPVEKFDRVALSGISKISTGYKKQIVSSSDFNIHIKKQIPQLMSLETKIEIINGKILVDGKETTDATFIGCALMDFAESMEHDGIRVILKDQDVFTESIITEV